MKRSFFNVAKNPWWALLPSVSLIWHSIYTVKYLHPHYLFFVCYSANLFLILGILFRSALLLGTGFGWSLIGFPLWFYAAYLNSDWEISAICFHLFATIVGAMAMRSFRLPKHTFLFAILIAFVLQFAARCFTDESLNINAAFRVYEGWEGLFSNYSIYTIVMLIGFGAFFYSLTVINNLFIWKSDETD